MKTPSVAALGDPESEIRLAARSLSVARKRPCLIVVLPHLYRREIPAFLAALDQIPPGGPVDVLLASHGGCIDSAYVMARALGRRQTDVAMFVPICAKSAATLLALMAEELVLGPLGELGPIDAQFSHTRPAAVAERCSQLAMFKAFEQLGDAALHLFGTATDRIESESGLTAFDARAKSGDLVAGLMGRVYDKVDPIRFGESARALEVAADLGRRVLARYRPDLDDEKSGELLRALIHDYACHGFPVDYEELIELGLPVRVPDEFEMECLDRLGRVLMPIEGTVEVIEAVDASAEKEKLPADGSGPGASKRDESPSLKDEIAA